MLNPAQVANMQKQMKAASVQPNVWKEGAQVQMGDNSQMAAFIGAMALADLVKTTLGPKGMDKILQSMDPNAHAGGKGVTVTNDGATILKSVPVDNAAAKILVNISMTQDKEVGDGTTSVVVLAGELLRQAEKLTQQKIHPQTIIRGWRKAVEVSHKTLIASAKNNADDKEKFRTDLLNIARTTLSSKVVHGDLDFFANMCVDAVLRLKGSSDLESIHIIKMPGGSMADSFLDEGFILKKSIGVGQPKRIENPKIMVANTQMDTDKIKIFGARVRVSGFNQVAAIEKAEKDKMKKKVEKILAYGGNVFINRQLIYNYPESLFTDAGCLSIEHADFEGVERLALSLGSEIVSTFDCPDPKVLGTCKLIEEVIIGEEKVIKFSGVQQGDACTIVLRGASPHLLDEVERSLHDALCVLTQTVKEPRTVLGGGASEMLMAEQVDLLAKTVGGKESYAIEAFAQALRQIPVILSDNAGYDSSELVSQLRKLHHEGKTTQGLNLYKGEVGCMEELTITESYKCKSQVLISAHEAAEMILRVDDTIKAAPRQRVD